MFYSKRWIIAASVGWPLLNAFADCETRVPDIPPPETPQIQERLNIYKGYGQGLDWFLRKAFTAASDSKIKKELTDLAPQVGKTLLWTGDKGAVVDVVMQEPLSGAEPPSLLYVAMLGSGGCFMDVLVEDVNSTHIYPAPLDKYRISDSASFFAWATRSTNGQVVYHPEFPGSRRPLQEAAVGSSAVRDALRQTAGIREVLRLTNVATQAKLQSSSSEIRLAIQNAISTLKSTEIERARVQQNLQAAIDRANAAAGALAWLDALSKGLAVAQLATQINGLIASSAPADVKTGVDTAGRAQDLGKLRGVLVDWQTFSSSEVKKIDDDYSTLTKIFAEKKTYIINSAQKAGAPPEALSFP